MSKSESDPMQIACIRHSDLRWCRSRQTDTFDENYASILRKWMNSTRIQFSPIFESQFSYWNVSFIQRILNKWLHYWSSNCNKIAATSIANLDLYLCFSNLACGTRSIRDVVANVWVWEIVVSQFELQSLYYVHFRTNTLKKFMNLLSLSLLIE